MAPARPRTVRTTCPYCGVGCGLLATVEQDGSVLIAGDPDHPANYGRLCSKGSALGETLGLEGRLLYPEIGGKRASWDEALRLVATRFADTIREHGPQSVAFYVSGQLLIEDYYAANKLMKGYIGTANIDTNSRLCMASSVAGHRRAFGSDTVPGCYKDLEAADLVVLVGSNLAWCHPVLFQRLLAAREKRGTRIVVADPRRTVTAEAADLHLALNSGSDVALFNGLLSWLHSNGLTDADYVTRFTSGMSRALAQARDMTASQTAAATGIDRATLEDFFRLFADTPRTVTAYSQGVNQSSAGTDKVNAIINCHLLTGRIGKPGMGPFSVTGQPNAMGGREVGGLANMLAAHMEIENPQHRALVQAFWGSPAIASQSGLKAVEMFKAVREGRIRVLWIMATNPADSLPQADEVVEALRSCPFVVVSDNVRETDTTAHAHVLLPASAWGEKDGTVTNSERRISRQRSFLDAPGEARPDWWIICEVAKRMGFSGFDYAGAHDIFDEYCRLTARDNNGLRDLDLSALAGMSAETYDAMKPVQWPVRESDPQDHGEIRFFAEGGFFTADRKGRFLPVAWRQPMSAPGEDYPLTLNTGRIRDQWHTMTRTGRVARLLSHMAEPFIELHPEDAARFRLAPAVIARVASERAEVKLRVLVTDRVQPSQAFAPIHWCDQFASSARIDTLVAPNTDPISGQPESKFTPVRVAPFEAAWYGYAMLRDRPRTHGLHGYWAAAPVTGGWQIELAGSTGIEDWAAFAGALAGETFETGACLAFHDSAAGLHRLAAFDGEKLALVLFVSPGPVEVSRVWAIEQLGASFTAQTRLGLLAGRGGADVKNRGAILCSCMNVGVNDIAGAIACGKRTFAEIGEATGAGTNCGSCRPEISRLIDAHRIQAAE